MQKLLLLLPLLTVLSACGPSTKLTATWSDPAAQGKPFKKVAVFALTSDETMRRLAEDRFVQELTGQTQGVTSYALVLAAESKDLDTIKARLGESRVDGAVVYRVAAVEDKERWVPGTAYYAPHYGSFGRYYSWAQPVVYDPGYLVREKTVQIETTVYAVNNEQLVWTGRSQTFNPENARTLIAEVVTTTVAALKQHGLIQ